MDRGEFETLAKELEKLQKARSYAGMSALALIGTTTAGAARISGRQLIMTLDEAIDAAMAELSDG